MADIGAYKAHQNMMKNPERRKAYIEAMKRRKKDTASRNKISKPSRSMMVDTTTSAYGDAGRGRPVPKYKEGGYCRGAGAAIKGTNFKGVF